MEDSQISVYGSTIIQVATYVAQSARLCYNGRKLAVYATNIG